MIEALGEHDPRIAASAWVHPSAVVLGEVELLEHSSVWPTAVLRGDMGLIRVGRGSNIQDGAVCHNTSGLSRTLVGDRVTVGHRAVLHGCIVEDDCLVGMGAIVMDNAVVGAGSFVAAGALVPPGREIPPGSFVRGMPAKVIRPVGPRETDMIAYSWDHYVKTVARYR